MVDVRDVQIRFGAELNRRMDLKGISYRQLAYKSRVTKGSMIHYKSRNSFPEVWNLILIADCLDCSVDELLDYDEPNTTPEWRAKRIPAIEKFYTEDEFADYFRERLIKFMKKKHMDLDELAQRSDISARTIDMYLSVHRWVPQTPNLLRLADALDCTPSDLLGY